MKCANPPCKIEIGPSFMGKKPRKGQKFCSGSCRAEAWREVHLPRCPHCGGAIEVTVGTLKVKLKHR